MLINFQAPISRRKRSNSSAHHKIKVYSPAKINLYLNIIGKYKNGFHKIESVVNRIGLFDKITIALSADNRIKFSCNYRSLEGKDNLCVKAADLLKKKLSIPYGFDIYLDKKIPVGAGLGGGSSNAAYTLLGINSILRLGLSEKELFDFGALLGSDVNFFISQLKWAHISRKGEDVKPLCVNTKFNYLLVYPKINVSTKFVYDNVKAGLTKFLDNVNILDYALRKKDYLLVEELSFNCLEKSALSIYKKLKSVRMLFEKRGFFCQLSGSGSTFFTILKDIPPYTKMNINSLIRDCKDRDFSVFMAQTY